MIEIRYRGGFGEWLFQYAFARILAERWGVCLTSPPLPDMPRAEPELPGRAIFGPLEVLSGWACELLSSGSLLRPRDLISPFLARVVVHGWFLRFEYFRDAEQKLRGWFHQESTHEGNGTAVCLRSHRPVAWSDPGAHAGRSKEWGRTSLVMADINSFLASARASNVTVFADEVPDRETARTLEPYGYNGVWNPLDTPASFRQLRGFRSICASAHHPFEWWAAFLNPTAQAWFYDPYFGGCRKGGRCVWIGGRPLARPDLRISDRRFSYAFQ